MTGPRATWFAVGIVLAYGAVHGVSTVTHLESADRLARGETDGIAINTDGALYPVPRPSSLGDAGLPGHPEQVWSAVADSMGNLYLGTGPRGDVIRIDPAGEKRIWFSVDEPLVTALALDGDGNLIVGASPGGVLYRVRPDGQGELWTETGEQYVWALLRTDDGRLFAATGERGIVMRIGPDGDVDPFFDSAEPHIVRLITGPGGTLYAGGAGRGLVYEIDPEGNGIVLLEDELPEVSALAVDGQGRVWVGLIAAPESERAPPELRLRLPDGVEVGRTGENLESLTESTGPTLRGVIEGIPRRDTAAAARIRGRLVRLEPTGRSNVVWESRDEGLFAILALEDTVYFGTGEPARLHAIEESGESARMATLPEGQTTLLRAIGKTVLLATSNPAHAYRLDGASDDPAVFVSSPLDAGGQARWGAIRWQLHGAAGAGRVEVYTRTGNSREPDATWSGWSPALTDPARSRVVNPDGRYLQWRVRFPGARDSNRRVSGMTVHYSPYNRPPEVRGFSLVDDRRWVATTATFRWSSRDADGDPVALELSYRRPGDAEWTEAGSSIADPDPSPGVWAEGTLTWDTSSVPEGPCEVRAIASDAATNTPEDAARLTLELQAGIVIDRTPPEYEIRPREGGTVVVKLEDLHSEIERLEWVRDGRSLARLLPRDGVYDSETEVFDVVAPESTGDRRLRGRDAAGNTVDFSLSP